jgi:hypothetical protein
MNGPTAEASAAVVIAKNPAKGQCLVNGIQLGVILTDYPPEQLLPMYVVNTRSSALLGAVQHGAPALAPPSACHPSSLAPTRSPGTTLPVAPR